MMNDPWKTGPRNTNTTCTVSILSQLLSRTRIAKPLKAITAICGGTLELFCISRTRAAATFRDGKHFLHHSPNVCVKTPFLNQASFLFLVCITGVRKKIQTWGGKTELATTLYQRHFKEIQGDKQDHEGPGMPTKTLLPLQSCPPHISLRWGCQAGWDALPLPDRSDPQADKQTFHRLVKDSPMPRCSRLVFWNKNALVEILSSAFWKAASADTGLEEKWIIAQRRRLCLFLQY